MSGFDALLPSTVEIFRPITRDDYDIEEGETSIGTFPCRFDPTIGKVVRSPGGNSDVIEGFIFLRPAAGLDQNDELEVDGGPRLLPLQLTKQRGFGPVHHVKVMVKRKENP